MMLANNKNLTFTYAEMKYFQMWYSRLDPARKEATKNMIKSGQLEIVQGGWTSSDESCANYEDLIMQMYIGHQFLKKEFGVTPRVGWMLDAFGHSAANAALFSDFGFDAMYFSRLDDDSRPRKVVDSPDFFPTTFLWRPNS